MEKLKMLVVSEDTVSNEMGGCGRYNPSLCGTKECSFNGTSRDD